MITKKDFTELINALESQYRFDQAYSEQLKVVFQFDDYVMYDNSKITEPLIAFIANQFEFPVEAKEKICSFMYSSDFGKKLDSLNVDILYDLLTNKNFYKTTINKQIKKWETSSTD